MARDKIALIYKGNGFFVSVPARDLSKDEVKEYGGLDFLLSLGLYEEPYTKPKPVKVEDPEIDDSQLDTEEMED